VRAFEDTAGVNARLTKRIRNVGPVAHQPADFGNFTRLGYQGNRVARRERSKLYSAAREERVATEEKRAGALARHCYEGGVDFLTSPCVEDLDLHASGAGSRFEVPQRGLRGVAWIDENRHTSNSRDKLTQELQSLRRQLTADKVDARRVATRPGETRDKTKRDRVFGEDEDNGDCRGCCSGRKHRRGGASDDH